MCCGTRALIPLPSAGVAADSASLAVLGERECEAT